MAFSTHDIVPDSPTNNFATLNPLLGATLTFSNGNLNVSGSGSTTTGTIAFPTSGTYYYEATISEVSEGYPVIGIVSITTNTTGYLHSKQAAIRPVNANGDRPEWVIDGVDREYDQISSTALAANDIIQVIYDADNGKVWFGINNTYYGVSSGSSTTVSASDIANGINPAYVIDTNYTYIPMVNTHSTSEVAKFNFGQDPTFGGAKSPTTTYTDANGIGAFYYQPPTGALALCTANLPDFTPDVAGDTPQDYFKAVTYTGSVPANNTTGSQNIDLGILADLIWIKDRNSGTNQNHGLFDSVRGFDKWVGSNTTSAQDATVNAYLSYVSGTTYNIGWSPSINSDTHKKIAWCWKAGGAPTADNTATSGAMTANSVSLNGTLQSNYTPAGSPTVYPKRMSINTDAGFSILKYRGITASSVQDTIPHGLSSTPEFIIIKDLDNTTNWRVYHKNITVNETLYLNDSTADVATADIIYSPNSSTITLGNGTSDGGGVARNNTDHICYAWHSVENYSKFGSYTGNGSTDGPFVYCGFRPALVITRTIASGQWIIEDNVRNPYNPVDNVLFANTADAAGTTTFTIDFLSTGFKIRHNAWADQNGSNVTILYMCWAEQPFKFSNAR